MKCLARAILSLDFQPDRDDAHNGDVRLQESRAEVRGQRSEVRLKR
jgi:hypothetical protein